MIKIYTVTRKTAEWYIGEPSGINLDKFDEMNIGELRAMMAEITEEGISDDAVLHYKPAHDGLKGLFTLDLQVESFDDGKGTGFKDRWVKTVDRIVEENIGQLDGKDSTVKPATKPMSESNKKLVKALTLETASERNKRLEDEALDALMNRPEKELMDAKKKHEESPGVESCEAIISYYSKCLQESVNDLDIEGARKWMDAVRAWKNELDRFKAVALANNPGDWDVRKV
jgi:hypothetical protein